MKPLSENLHSLLPDYTKALHDLRGLIYGSLELINDFDKTLPEDGDTFFQKYGVGNKVFEKDRPYERMQAYELLLFILFEYNQVKFKSIFKGTPYYFLGWTAFQIGDYEKGIFYMDAAMTEDLTRKKQEIRAGYDFYKPDTLTPAIRFLLLNSTRDIGLDVSTNLIVSINNEVLEFNKLTQNTIKLDNIIIKFIIDTGLINNHSFRTIITSFYTFILEYQERKTQILLRSAEGGTTEPFLLHLLKGCVVWESLLKQKSPKSTTLEPALTKLFPTIQLKHGNQSFDRILNIIKHAQDKTSIDTSFNVTFGIRNTVSHNLFWPDIFNNDNYEMLYKTICRAIFWSIYELWIK